MTMLQTSDPLDVPLFPEIEQGAFIRRPNRFVIECLLHDRVVTAHLPNPGRLWELLLPGRSIGLVRHHDASKKIPYTAVSVERDGETILLHTLLTNRVVQRLLEQGRITGFEGMEIEKREVTFGASRFDFLLRKGNEQIVLEVKSCTLFGQEIAMFPDAVTQRGRKHLLELADLVTPQRKSAVLFLVHWKGARFFLPDFHTDFAFSRTFLDLKNKLIYKPLSVSWDQDLRLREKVSEPAILWEVLEKEARDGGSYLLILTISRDTDISVGALGRRAFPKGHYLYVGSAKRNLSRRLERHGRRRKKKFWHIDYLREHADRVVSLPVRSAGNLEHSMAQALLSIAQWTIPRFGASDCDCPTHLFGMDEDPIHSPPFISLLQYFRIDRLDTSPHLLYSGTE